jgi:hypothetical protein
MNKNTKILLIAAICIIFIVAGYLLLKSLADNNTVNPIPTVSLITGDGVSTSPSPAPTASGDVVTTEPSTPSPSANTVQPTETTEPTTTAEPTETIQPAGTEQYKTYTKDEINDVMNAKQNDIADPLINDYFYWMHQLDGEAIPKNFIMAFIYNQLAGYFLYDRETKENEIYTDWEVETPNAYNYMQNVYHITPIPACMTRDCVKMVSVVQPIGDEYKDFYEVMNEIRGSNDEVEFLQGLNDLGYYAVDIYVEDMLELDRRIPCNGIKLYNTDATNTTEIFDNISKMPEDDQLQDYLNKFNRQANFSNELQNKEWNLFLFAMRDMQPSIISVYIRTYETKGGYPLTPKIN